MPLTSQFCEISMPIEAAAAHSQTATPSGSGIPMCSSPCESGTPSAMAAAGVGVFSSRLPATCVVITSTQAASAGSAAMSYAICQLDPQHWSAAARPTSLKPAASSRERISLI